MDTKTDTDLPYDDNIEVHDKENINQNRILDKKNVLDVKLSKFGTKTSKTELGDTNDNCSADKVKGFVKNVSSVTINLLRSDSKEDIDGKHSYDSKTEIYLVSAESIKR